MADLAGWPYWKDISITGQAGAGTDYQVELEIGDSAGGDFHLEGHCTNFPQDIRITDDDGTTLLDHFVEDLTADPIVVHVEVKDDLGSNRDIRVYYGKNGETTASDGDNTFIQYKGLTTSAYKASNIQSPPCIFEFRFSANPVQDNNNVFAISENVNPDTGDSAYITVREISTTDIRTVSANEGSTTGVRRDGSLANDAKYKIVLDGTDAKYYKNDILRATHTGSTVPTGDNMGINLWLFESIDATIHWAFIRKYNSPEPAFASAGAEQTPAGGVAPTGVFYGPLIGPFGGPI